MVKRFDLEYPDRFEEELFNYLSIPEDDFPIASKLFESPIMNKKYFDLLTDQYRSPHLWRWIDDKWQLRKTSVALKQNLKK